MKATPEDVAKIKHHRTGDSTNDDASMKATPEDVAKCAIRPATLDCIVGLNEGHARRRGEAPVPPGWLAVGVGPQ